MEKAPIKSSALVPGIASIRNDPAKRIVYARMSGVIDLATMRTACAQLRQASDSYGGSPHLLIADMRGMQPVFGEVAQLMGEGIGYSRQHGVVRCAHLSDHAIIKLQAANLARAATPEDDITVNVVSEAEAERLMAEELQRLK